MINLLKRKTEQQIVAEIHNEFDTAEDRLLKQAELLLSELNIPTESSIEKKAETLKSLGFINSEVVKQADRLSEKRKKEERKLVSTKELAETILYYKQNYPFQKFLTESELERICEKYNLIFAPVANYIKDVPEKNINEIKSVPILKVIDYIDNTFQIIDVDNSPSFERMLQILGKNNGMFSNNEVREITRKYRNSDCPNWVFGTSEDYMLFYDIKRHFNIEFRIKKYKRIEREGLFIAAPPSHFNLSGLSKQNKFSFLNITVTEINDPIVFRYCRGGVQVVSKWGLEANDELLVNEKLN